MSPASYHLVLVDTSAWICFFARTGYREIKECLQSLLDDDRVAVGGPIVLELLQGCRPGEERVIQEMIASLHWLTTVDEHWYQAGRMASALRQKGVTVSAIDTLIATLAETHDCALLQRDSDFDMIARHTGLQLFAMK